MEFDKVYEPQKTEPYWANSWLESGVFVADREAPGPVFSIAVPPPNVTGSLHMGHMLDHSVIDTAVRWHRMRGDNTLFLPGVDHAGIATQMLVERSLKQEGISRKQLGREEFEKRVWAWKEKFGARITTQMKRIGDSCDWSRERFTLSPELSRAVTEAFVLLYERDLIYRGAYMVNWCPSCQTAISDVEVKHEETNGSLWHIRYPVEGSDRFLTVATTRPETMLGDTAVAVNPHDERYLDLQGKTVLLPLMNRPIPIVADSLADPKFGTGVVKITPAHDPNDFEVGKRHNLPHVKVIDEEGKMTAEAGAYAGLDRFAARKRVVADLEALGRLAKVEPHTLPLAKCDRCGTIVEPLVSTQWFVKTKPLAEKCLRAVNDGSVIFVPDNWNKTFHYWMENIRDWCISRQLWWGHRIPAWHCDDCHRITVSRETPRACAHCGSHNLQQDPDVLDTWFSSSLWPFSTLGWPDATPDLAKYYPTSLMITGFDILFFWVARMLMMGLELTNNVPFRVVHMHGLVRDADKQKMSKTKGNVIDPLDINDRYGTDAVRLSLLIAVAPGTDITYTEERAAAAQKYANKIWNGARLIWMNMESSGVEPGIPDAGQPEHVEDRWIFSLLNRAAENINRAFEQHRYHEAADTLWHFFWHDFCDWYLEIKKLRFTEKSGMTNDWRNLLNVFGTFLRLQHPLMPFLTEELWHRFGQSTSIAVAAFPEPTSTDEAAEREVGLLQEMVTAVRTLRAKNAAAAEWVLYRRAGAAQVDLKIVERLAKMQFADVHEGNAPKLEGSFYSTAEFDVWPKLAEVDDSAVRGKLEKENLNLTKLIGNLQRQLGDAKFLQGAPATVVDGMREKLAGYSAQLQKNEEALNNGHRRPADPAPEA